MIREAIGTQLTPERRPYTPSISKAGQCPRNLTYWRRGIPESDPTPRRMGIVWAIGDAIEAALDDALRRSGIPITSYQRKVRIPFSGGVIFGRLDRIIEPDTVLDYKSINRYGFEEVTRDGAKPENIAQVNLYIHALRLEGEERFTRGRILYINKDSGELHEHEFAYDPQLAKECIATFELVEAHAASGTLPDRPAAFTPDRTPCVYCPWRSACWGMGQHAPDGEGIADLSFMADDLASYFQLSQEARMAEEQMEAIRRKAQAALADSGKRVGVAGPFRVRIITQTRERIHPDLIPDLFRAAAITTETLTTVRIEVAGGRVAR